MEKNYFRILNFLDNKTDRITDEQVRINYSNMINQLEHMKGLPEDFKIKHRRILEMAYETLRTEHGRENYKKSLILTETEKKTIAKKHISEQEKGRNTKKESFRKEICVLDGGNDIKYIPIRKGRFNEVISTNKSRIEEKKGEAR